MIDYLNEEWRTTKEYTDYEVSSEGRVRRKFLFLVLSPRLYNNDIYVTVRTADKLRAERVCDLVASAFIENPKNLNSVEHIDGNIANNKVSNLRWIYKESRTGFKVGQFDKKGNLIKVFDNPTEASKEVGISVQQISHCINIPEKYHSAGGFVWERISREEYENGL